MGMVSAIFLSFCVDWINSLNTYPMLASIMSLTFFILLFLSFYRLKWPEYGINQLLLPRLGFDLLLLE